MKTLFLRNVPDEVYEALEQRARRESLSVSAVAAQPDQGVDPDDVVAAVRSGRDR